MITVNDFIKELQALPKELRKKPVVISAPNGINFDPKCKRLIDLQKGQTIFDSYDKCEKMIITFDEF
ncbi:MAG: hypothetical protein R6U15_01770 [Candidatus Izemoplasmatales bacterium]